MSAVQKERFAKMSADDQLDVALFAPTVTVPPAMAWRYYGASLRGAMVPAIIRKLRGDLTEDVVVSLLDLCSIMSTSYRYPVGSNAELRSLLEKKIATLSPSAQHTAQLYLQDLSGH